MLPELLREGDVVSPSFGALAGVRGVVTRIGRYVTIEFPRPVKKYPHDSFSCASCTWGYDPSNVRLVAFSKTRPDAKKM